MFGKSLHILCFGDSLSAGFTLTGPELHPYEVAMKSTLQKAFPTYEITTDVQGVAGDQVVTPPGGFLTRMDMLYERLDQSNPYTHAVILGGTNDLAVEHPVTLIWKALKDVYQIPLSHNTTVLALTIPECPACFNVKPQKRDRINEAMLARQAHDFYTLDLCSLIPFQSLPEKRRNELWDDGVHFTHEGYDLMGNLIGERLVEIITAQLNESATGEEDEGEEEEEEEGEAVLEEVRELR
ncbi:SGNH hydrolase [Glarea lozoyensis ATCC 20868]|uniref:SGNH hydrolase n=1 Tax=Glarea lozoyensis (strain ATCC 20868 / MF5171) TaxID=1116229 RepID=S3DDW3_GLAL2|nr:SGNH hydrolase [Glarea lozoyensis ATCC 20868]EPE36622.1 SGNH hydrolase [Glarea lozoyensis ATCC 20868]